MRIGNERNIEKIIKVECRIPLRELRHSAFLDYKI